MSSDALRTILYVLPLTAALTAPVAAQSPCPDDHNRGNNNRSHHCEMREYTVNDTGRLTVDSAMNGGIKVTGADRSNVLVRARVQTNAPTMDEARSLAGMVRVEATPGNVRVQGPEGGRDRGWGVSYEILVPRRTALDLKAHNGGITISDVEGEIQFDTQNGGVTLQRLGGDVKGKTVNGGVRVELAGNIWRGNQLDVQTTNGGIHVSVPDNYSARFETSTVNGNLNTDLPEVQVSKDRRDRNVSVTLGSGGPLVRLATINGGIRLNRP